MMLQTLVDHLDFCTQCSPALSRYTTIFNDMVHQGTELKKRKKINPTPKRPESELTHYRDIPRQNEWLKANIIDSVGNYLHCFNCIVTCFKDKITSLRKVKRQECTNPIVEITKSDVEEQRFGEFVIMLVAVDLSFKNWWRSISPTVTVEVRPIHTHTPAHTHTHTHTHAHTNTHTPIPTHISSF